MSFLGPITTAVIGIDLNRRISMSTQHKINKIRAIVANKETMTVEGQWLDLYSASAILTVYEALTNDNREKYASMSLSKMAWFAFKMLDKHA